MRGVRTHALHATPTSPSSSQHLLKTSARPVLRAARSRPNSDEHPLPCLPLPPPSWASTFPPFIRSLPSSCLRRRVRRPRSPTLQSSRREQGRCSVVRPPMPLSGLDTLLHAMDHLARPRGGAGGGASPSAARSPHVRWVDWRVATAGGSPPAATLSRPSSACPPRAAATLGQDAGDGYGWTTPPSRGDRDIAGNSSPVTPGVDDAPVRRGVFPIGGVAGATPAGSPPSSIASNDWPQRPEVVDATATCGGAAYGGGSSGGGWAAPPSAAILPPWDAAAPAAAAGRAPVPPPPRQCAHCGTTKTSQWRTGGRVTVAGGGSGRGGNGGPQTLPYTLCNACGIKHRRRGQSAAAAVAAGKDCGPVTAAAGQSRGGGADGCGSWPPPVAAAAGGPAGTAAAAPGSSPWGFSPVGASPAGSPPATASPPTATLPPFGLATELFGMYEGGGRRRGVAKRAYVRRRRAEASLQSPPRGGAVGGGAFTSRPARAAAAAAVAAATAVAGGAAAAGSDRPSGGLPPLPPAAAASASPTVAAPASGGRAAGGGGGAWRVAPLWAAGSSSGPGGPPHVAAPPPLLPSFAAVLSASGLR